MKHTFRIALLGLFLALSSGASAQEENRNVNNQYGPPNFTGGTVDAPSQYFAAYHQNTRQAPEATAIYSVYPNPARSSASVLLAADSREPVELFVINMNGTVLRSYEYNAGEYRLDFDVSALPSGIYSIQVQERGKSMQSVKLLKEE